MVLKHVVYAYLPCDVNRRVSCPLRSGPSIHTTKGYGPQLVSVSSLTTNSKPCEARILPRLSLKSSQYVSCEVNRRPPPPRTRKKMTIIAHTNVPRVSRASRSVGQGLPPHSVHWSIHGSIRSVHWSIRSCSSAPLMRYAHCVPVRGGLTEVYTCYIRSRTSG